MFIKQAYQHRIKKELDERLDNEQRMSKPIQIGSIKNEKINYAKDEQFFSKQDVPQKVRQNKQQVKQMIDPDYLQLRKRRWNSSVSVPKYPHLQETHERKLIKIKLGLLDYPAPKYIPPKIYEGTQVRDDFKNWNVSNQIDTTQFKENYLKLTMKSKLANKEKQLTLLKDYIKPYKRVQQLNHQLLIKKVQQQNLRGQIRKAFLFDDPQASKERTDAVVFRMAYEKSMRQFQKTQDHQFYPHKPDLHTTLKQDCLYQKKHDGVYQQFKDQGVVIQGWSCCMAEGKNAQGCISIKKDKKKWNLSSYT